MSLTLDVYNALPLANAKTRIELQGIKIHTQLPDSPISICTKRGDYRVGEPLYHIAKGAYEALAASGGVFEGPYKGGAKEVLLELARSTGDEVASVCEDEGMTR